MQLSWAYATPLPAYALIQCREVLRSWDAFRHWWGASTLVMPLCRQQGSQLGSQTSSANQTRGLGLLFSAVLSIKNHLPSNISVCILIFPGKCWQLYYPTNINCAFVSVSVQLVHWKCVLALVQIHFSAPKEIFIVLKACWDCFQFIHNCF